MTHADDLNLFEQAVKALDVDRAFEIASGFKYVGLYSALELCRALALARDRRFDRAATRWLVRLRQEAGASLDDLQLATAAFGVLARTPESEDAWATLTSVLRASD